jgi:predicted  nucleic acid-binding Zn-ribbon protein
VQETILKLIQLQELDNKIKDWRQTAADGPGRLALAREKLTALEAELASREAGVAENLAKKTDAETAVGELNQRKATNQARQLKARDPNEYRAVLKEEETIGHALGAQEDELLALLDAGEKLAAALPALRSSVEEETKAYAEVEEKIRSVIADGLEHEAGALRGREALAASVPPQILGKYANVARNRDGQAVAPVVSGMCRCCRLSIPPQLYNELQRNDKLITCPNCARILWWMHHPYFKDHCTEPEPAAAPEKPEKPEKPAKAAAEARKPKAKAKPKGKDAKAAPETPESFATPETPESFAAAEAAGQ